MAMYAPSPLIDPYRMREIEAQQERERQIQFHQQRQYALLASQIKICMPPLNIYDPTTARVVDMNFSVIYIEE